MFSKEDLMRYRALKQVISKGDYRINGEAAIMVASLFTWFNGLEKIISDNIMQCEHNEQKGKLAPVGGPKPIGKVE